MVRLILVTSFEKENTKNRREEKENHEICRALREACCYFRAWSFRLIRNGTDVSNFRETGEYLEHKKYPSH